MALLLHMREQAHHTAPCERHVEGGHADGLEVEDAGVEVDGGQRAAGDHNRLVLRAGQAGGGGWQGRDSCGWRQQGLEGWQPMRVCAWRYMQAGSSCRGDCQISRRIGARPPCFTLAASGCNCARWQPRRSPHLGEHGSHGQRGIQAAELDHWVGHLAGGRCGWQVGGFKAEGAGMGGGVQMHTVEPCNSGLC